MTIIYFHVYIILDFSITNRNASVLCQSKCACLHKTVNMVVFFVKSNENTTGRANVQSCSYNEKREYPITLPMFGTGQMSRLNARCSPITSVHCIHM